ncbi:MAG: beta-hydroxyacyl-ACP dehydratase [Planctomycetota bacterium]
MRWMWIDRVVELVPREKLVAVKQISMAEDHLHDHFEPNSVRRAVPIMPASLIVEGMAQTAGVLVGHAEGFREKVVLAKVSKAELELDARPGDTIRYTATIDRFTHAGASTRGQIELFSWTADGLSEPQVLGRVDLIFSHLDNNMGGQTFPEHNFVFSETFATLLSLSGVESYPVPG